VVQFKKDLYQGTPSRRAAKRTVEDRSASAAAATRARHSG